jgi:hypothetical protein
MVTRTIQYTGGPVDDRTMAHYAARCVRSSRRDKEDRQARDWLMHEMHEQGDSLAKIALVTGFSREWVRKILKKPRPAAPEGFPGYVPPAEPKAEEAAA